ncbi:MAG: RidA family protein [Myxococcales bacterium]|nr:RidA family protein [Myxococcales bacterium]MCB9754128.1 RidA family protein [Myxococcales bacterium]
MARGDASISVLPWYKARVRQDPRHVFSASPYEPTVGYARAVRVGDRVHVSGTAPIGDRGENVGEGDPYRQAQRCLELIDRAVAQLAAGARAVIVRTRVFLTRAEDWREVGRAHGERFSAARLETHGERPACTFVVVAALLDPAWRVEIEAEAALLDAPPG